MVLSSLVFTPHGKLRFGMAGHMGVIVGGIEQQAVAQLRFHLPDALEEPSRDRMQVRFCNPVPFFPVPFAGEFLDVNGPEMNNRLILWYFLALKRKLRWVLRSYGKMERKLLLFKQIAAAG